MNDAVAPDLVETAYREAVTYLECLADEAIGHVPDLTPRTRGPQTHYRLSETNWDAVFGLKLFQVVGNVKAGDPLVELAAPDG